MLASPRESFLDAIKNDTDSFLNFISQHKSKNSYFNLEEILPVLHSTQLDEFWKNAYQLCESVMCNAITVAEDDLGLCSKEEANKAVDVLNAIISLAKLMIKLELNSAEHLIQCVTLLHGLLPAFPEDRDGVKNNICHLCEAWWAKDLVEKENICNNAVVYLIQKTLSAKPLKGDVIRLWHLREALQLMLSDKAENKEVIWELLEQCAVSPIYLSVDEGQKFISLLFSLKDTFIETLHKAIKKYLPDCKMKQAETYGAIYYRAWLNSTGDVKEKLETYCIQDFMYFAVHLPRKGPHCLVFLLHRLLNYFHRQKRQRSVTVLLLNLYDPIIWRSLKVANGIVRANAANLFFDVYPLENPETNVEETDEMLQKQFNVIKSLLKDPSAKVREVAVIGTATILNQHWEVIPVDEVKNLLTILVKDLAYDSSSADVRAAVFKGMRALLDNPLSHPTLNNILPTLGNCFHDIAERVRIAFCNLLLKIKLVRTLKYWHIVPMEHLMARLEIDNRSVARHIVNLIYPSYLPISKPQHVQLERCVTLIEEHRAASRVFFQYVHLYIGIESIVNCIILLGKGLFMYAKISLNRMNDSSELNSPIHDRENKENVTGSNLCDSINISCIGDRDDLPFDNPDVAVGALDAMSIMWTSINNKLHEPKQKEQLKLLIANLARIMPTLFRFFKDKDAWDSVIYLSSFLPPAHVPTFTGHCFSRLKNLPEDCESSTYVNIIESLCNHGRAGDIIELCLEWIKDSFSETPKEQPQRKAKARQKKKVKFVEIHQPKPLLALGFIETLLEQPLCREYLLCRHSQLAKQFMDELNGSKNSITKRMHNIIPTKQCSDEYILKSFILHNKLLLLLHNKEESNKNKALCTIKGFLEWVESDIFLELKNLYHDVDTNITINSTPVEPTDCQILALAIIEHLLKVCADVILIGFADSDFCLSASRFALLCLKIANSNERLLLLITKIMYQILEYSLLKQESKQHGTVVSEMMSKLIHFAGKFCISDPDKARKVLLEIKPAIFECVLSIYKRTVFDDTYQPVIAVILSGTIDEMTKCIHKHQGFENCDIIDDLPLVSSVLISAIGSHKNIMRSFLCELVEYLKCEDMNEPSKMLAASHLIYTVSKDKSCKVEKEDLKEAVSTIWKILNKLKVPEGHDNNDESCNIDQIYVKSAISVISQLKDAET